MQVLLIVFSVVLRLYLNLPYYWRSEKQLWLNGIPYHENIRERFRILKNDDNFIKAFRADKDILYDIEGTTATKNNPYHYNGGISFFLRLQVQFNKPKLFFVTNEKVANW